MKVTDIDNRYSKKGNLVMMGSANSTRTINSLRNMVTGVAGQILSIVLRFITRTVFIYTLGKEYLGISGLFTDIFTMLSLTELGIDTAIIYRMYKPIAEKNDKRVRILLNFYKTAYTVIGMTILLIGLCLIPGLPYLVKDYETLSDLHINAVLVFVLYLLQTVTSYLFFAYRSSVVIASQKKYMLDIANYTITLIDYVIRLVVLVIWKSFVAYIAVGVASSALKNVVRAIIAQKKYPQYFIPEKEKIEKNEVKEMLKDCGALFTFKANGVILKATDNLVLSKFIGIAIVGVYSNYLMLYTTLKNLLHQVYIAVSASMGNLFAEENIKKKYEFFEVMNYLTYVVYGTGCVGVSVCADELIQSWISTDYVIKQPFAVLVGLELLMAGMVANLEQIRNVSGIFRKMWFRPLLGIIVNIVVSISMVNIYGIYGVIIGTLVAHISTIFTIDPYIIHKYTFNNYMPVSHFYKKNFIYFLTLSVVGAVDYFICSRMFVGYGWLSVIIHVIISGLSVPLAFLVIFRNTKECKYLLGVVKRFTKKFIKR